MQREQYRRGGVRITIGVPAVVELPAERAGYDVQWARGAAAPALDLLVHDAGERQVDRLVLAGARGPIARVAQDARTTLELLDHAGGPDLRIRLTVRRAGRALESDASELAGAFRLEAAGGATAPVDLEPVDETPSQDPADSADATAEPLPR